jgi:hypothetical protein
VITALVGLVHGSSAAVPQPTPSIDPAVLDEILRRLIEIEGRLPD